MRILLVNHFPLEGSGSGVYTKNIASQLSKNGHEVKVIVVDNEPAGNYDFPVRVINNYQFPCFTTHPKSNNTFYNLSPQEMNDYLNDFITTIKEEVNKFKPDLIHSQHIWVAAYASSHYNIPYVVTAHGTDIKGYNKDKRYHNIAQKAAKRAEKIITISRQVHNDVRKHFQVPEERLELILNGFDEKIFKPMKINKNELLKSLLNSKISNGKIDKNTKIVNFVGKLADFKGIDLLLKAAKLYEKEIPGVITLISGDGHLKENLQDLTKKLELKSVYFLGNQPQTTVAKLYNIADLAVVPSRIEPFGLVAVEALACGTPVIASNAGGLPDFINDKVGRLFPMDNYKALSKNIISALKNEEKKSKGSYAAKYARANFSWERVIEELIKVYKNILSTGR